MYILFPLSASILQLYLSGTPILAPATITGFFLVFINIQNSQINTDTLTGLNNRRSAFNYLDDQIRLTTDKKSTSVYMIDVNYFKEINDTWGHIEGDHALNIIGSALKNFSQKYNLFVARFGGDEFMIIRDCNCDVSDKIIVDSFRTILADTCRNNDLKYDISVSIGYAKTSHQNISLYQLIEQADAMLYKEKQEFHKKHNCM